MLLALDIGNTLAKLTLLDGGRVVECRRAHEPDVALAAGFFERWPIDAAVMIWARRADALADYVRERIDGVRERIKAQQSSDLRFLEVRWDTPVPIVTPYTAPETQGADRLAAMVGASVRCPGRPVLVADLGTAITFDLLSAEGEFLGGNISPGANMRLRALNQFTEGVPFEQLGGQTELIATTLRSAIVSGVVNAIVYEAEGYIARLSARYPDLQVIFTGGDGEFFADRIKNRIFAEDRRHLGQSQASLHCRSACTIFAEPNLVAIGLNRIFEYNYGL